MEAALGGARSIPTRPKITVDQIENRGTVPLWPDAADVYGCGRSKAYEMARDGRLPVIKVGRKYRVPVAELLKLVGRTP